MIVKGASVEVEGPDTAFTYDDTDSFFNISDEYANECPDFVWLTDEEISEYVTDGTVGSYYVSEDNFDTYCSEYVMFMNLDSPYYAKTFETLVSELEIGDQLTVTYLETDSSFEECKYEYSEAEKLICAVQNLNEIYDSYVVAIYIELE